MLPSIGSRTANKFFRLGSCPVVRNRRPPTQIRRTYTRLSSSRTSRTSAFVRSTCIPTITVRALATMAPPRLETVATSVENGIGIVKYNRPKNANSISPNVFKDLVQAFKWATTAPEIKVVVYTGEGKFFSAGLDLVSVPENGPVLSDESIESLR